MIPVLHSIDSLLNRFDELSQCHSSFISNFEKNFTDISNPLRDVSRNEDEQKKTTESLLTSVMNNDKKIASLGTVADFNRHIIKSRCRNRPPSYSSYDNNLIRYRTPSRNSLETTLSTPAALPLTETTIKASIIQPVISTSMNDFNKLKVRVTPTIKPKVLLQVEPTTQRYTRSPITVFTKETANRLSKPKRYHELIDQKVSPKRIYRRPKPYQSNKKEIPRSSSTTVHLPPLPSVQIKRTNPTTIKPPTKKLKTDNNFSIKTTKITLVNNYSRPAIIVVSPPTVSLTFPTQSELKPFHVTVAPKVSPTKKTITILTNRKCIISHNRMKYLMT